MKHNQHSMLKSNRVGIGEKLRQSLSNLTVDALGLEIKTANSLRHFFEQVSIKENVRLECLSIRIAVKESIHVGLFNNDVLQKQMTIPELVNILKIPMISPGDFEKLVNKIKQFLQARCDCYRVADLFLSPTVVDQTIRLHLMTNQRILESLTFPDLVKAFSI